MHASSVGFCVQADKPSTMQISAHDNSATMHTKHKKKSNQTSNHGFPKGSVCGYEKLQWERDDQEGLTGQVPDSFDEQAVRLQKLQQLECLLHFQVCPQKVAFGK